MARVSASRAGSSTDSPGKPPSPTSESAPEVCKTQILYKDF